MQNKTITRTLLLSAAFIFSISIQAQDKKAKALLDQVSAKVKSYSSITIDFKYDSNTDTYYEKVIKINYLKSGWRFDESDLSYEFHKKIPKIENVKIRGEVVNQVKKSALDVKLKDNKGSKNKFGN